MANTFHDIKILEIIEETANAKSFIFDIPSELRDEFQYKSGQYLTLKFDIDGEEFRRSYSLSSAPCENKWRVCVKRVKGGKISNYLCDHLSVGDEVSLMTPEGRFTFTPNPENEGNYYLFAAGSGITPMLSIAKEILENEPLSTVFMLYGNKSDAEVIYLNELNDLVQKYGGQFHLKHAYSSLQEKKGLLGGLFRKTSVDLPHFPGKIAKDTIKKMLSAFPVKNMDKAHAFICGPGSMNEFVKKTLVKNGFSKNNVHFESFGTTAAAAKSSISGGEVSEVIVKLNDETITLNIDASVTILDSLLEKGYDPPHSCCSGACSSCMAKMTEGKVNMDVTHALDEDDIADGYILTCQARVDGENVEIVYE